ncbi:hypothetical protein ACIO3O_32025 [Streptomyces sp. NPDC087440]|uniref:hypothetical protein n=1 Tax=Streptomyces sp. NPDC087440 TaxID=3365790 RepID=UPI0038308684
MKLRHVRAVAVFGIAVVALTGARGSHGGSCGGGSSSHGSSSSSSSGGSDSSSSSSTGGYDSSSSSSSSSGGFSSSTTGGSDSTSSSSSSSSSGSVSGVSGGGSNAANRDLTITDCKYDPSRGMLATITARNSSSSSTYNYSFTVSFTNNGSTVGSRSTSISAVAPGQSRSVDVSTVYVKRSTETLSGRCEVKYASRTSS